MIERFFVARDVAKANSLNVDAFDSPESGPVAYRGREYLCDPSQLRSGYPLQVKPAAIATGEELITVFPGIGGRIIEDCETIGFPVVVTNLCLAGSVYPVYGYPDSAADLQSKGAILGDGLSRQKTQIKLILALGVMRDLEEFVEYSNRN